MKAMAEGWIPKKPTPKQMRFLVLPNKEAFYGGAAGGGKSEALLMAAAMHLDTPGYNAILFRRTLEDHMLPSGLISRSLEWWGNRAQYNGAHYRWTAPSGATVTFGYMRNPMDHFRYQSAEFQLIGFDELPQFEEPQYRYMFSRLRRLEGANVPLRMRAAGNPDGPGVIWVKTRFNLPEGRHDRPFIPARLDDNPYLDRESYRESLQELDPITRSRLMEGDWSIRDMGGMFRRSWFQLVTELPHGLRGTRYWDLAATERGAYTAGALVGEKNGIYYIADMRRSQLRPKEVEDLVLQTAMLDQQRPQFTHIEIWMEQEPGSSGVAEIDRYARRVLQGYAFRGDKVTGPKELRAAPLSSAAETGNVKILMGPWVNTFLDEAEAFPEGEYKDQVDAASGALNKLVLRPRKPKIRHV